MSKLEELEGHRWALQTAQQISGVASTKGGIPEIIAVVRRGLLGDKPEGYKAGVRRFIEELEIAASITGMRRKQA